MMKFYDRQAIVEVGLNVYGNTPDLAIIEEYPNGDSFIYLYFEEVKIGRSYVMPKCHTVLPSNKNRDEGKRVKSLMETYYEWLSSTALGSELMRPVKKGHANTGINALTT